MTVSPRHQPQSASFPAPTLADPMMAAGAADAEVLVATWLGRGPASSAADSGAGGLRGELTMEIQAASLAESTRAQYRLHAQAWIGWCTGRGIDPLAASGMQLADHLCEYAVLLDEGGQPVRDGLGRLQPAVTPKTVSQRLSAITKLVELAGQPTPGGCPEVRRTMKGLRRIFRRAARGRAAVDWTLLGQLVTAAREPLPDALRRRAAVLLRLLAGATPGEIARLGWDDVSLFDDRTVLTLPDGRRPRVRGRQVTVRRNADRDACLVMTLRALSHTLGDPSSGSVVGLTRQGVQQLLASVPAGPTDPGARRTTSCVAVAASCPWWGRFPGDRDAALLLTGWWAALRPSSLGELQWRDVRVVRPTTIRLRLRFSKTDQLGEGATLYLPASHADPDRCPVRALLRWRDILSERLGVDLTDGGCELPVFPRLHRSGDVLVDERGRPMPLSADAVNDVVVRHARAAGLPVDGRFALGGHSLRVGFITEALRRGLTVREVQEVTQHRDITTLLAYQRVVRAIDDHPQMRLMGIMAEAGSSQSAAPQWPGSHESTPSSRSARSRRIVMPFSPSRR